MVKLIFTAYKTTDEFFFIVIFAIYKNCNRILSKKIKIGFQKILGESTKIFLKKKKTKGAKMLLNNIEIFLKKKKKRSVNMVVNDIKIF